CAACRRGGLPGQIGARSGLDGAGVVPAERRVTVGGGCCRLFDSPVAAAAFAEQYLGTRTAV
ncbi:hypothetical protein NGM37_33925, partial [Streptomyces sp. TRM76130]|nr:hypothetical protein [Streptomyces sp. TRM76130]